MQKYIDALDNLLGEDHAYYSGDKNVDTIMELILKSKDSFDIIKVQQIRLEQQAEKIKKLKVLLNKLYGIKEVYSVVVNMDSPHGKNKVFSETSETYDNLIGDIAKAGIEEFVLELMRIPHNYISKRELREMCRLRGI